MGNRIAVCLAVCIAVLTPISGTESPAGPRGTIIAELDLRDTPIEVVLSKIMSQTSATIVARGKTHGVKVDLRAREVTVERALDMIVNQKSNWLWYHPDRPGFYEIWDQDSYRSEVIPKGVRQMEKLVEVLDIQTTGAISGR